MSKIATFQFSKDSFNKIRNYKFGLNWPVVYVIEDGKEVYIGETTSAFSRSRQHYDNVERKKLKSIHIISDDEFNKSATLDIESWLIQYMAADGVFSLQNGNGGLQNHNYYDKEKYKSKFEITWQELMKIGLAKHTLGDIKNSDLFKYSPYKTLTEDQLLIANQIYADLKLEKNKAFIINGKPGTGKTILATYLFKFLKEQKETRSLSIALVVPMTSLRSTIRKVFRNIKGLSSNMVIGPNDVVKKEYDLIIVDESHRLRRRKNITNYASFDKINSSLELGKEGTELDWIMKNSKYQIFFYDENQSVKPSDIRKEDFKEINAKYYTLITQMRVEAGEDYIQFVDNIFENKKEIKGNFKNYDFKIFNNIEDLFLEIKNKDKHHGLSRVVAGYAWPWHTKNGEKGFDIEIEGLKAVWNSTATDWVNSPNAINEVGCIHTVQGYDLNYVGVIIGPELDYDPINNKFIVNKGQYFDRNGHAGIQDPSELERYIINIYKTLLTRGIKGTFVYVCNKNIKDYLEGLINDKKYINEFVREDKIISPYRMETIGIPLVGSAPCGAPLLGEENTEGLIMVDKNKIKPGYQYFVLRAIGDSMNKSGINDGDLVLCKFGVKPETGDRVVALLGGENVTIKFYDKKDGKRILLPKSTNSIHQPIIPQEGDSVQGIVQEVVPEIYE